MKIVVSYADMDQKHNGTIYQATNWIYLGKYNENKPDCSYIINGKRLHGRTISSKGWKHNEDWIKKNIDSKAEKYISCGKHKYIYCFDKKLRDKYLKVAKQYPKKQCANVV